MYIVKYYLADLGLRRRVIQKSSEHWLWE